MICMYTDMVSRSVRRFYEDSVHTMNAASIQIIGTIWPVLQLNSTVPAATFGRTDTDVWPWSPQNHNLVTLGQRTWWLLAEGTWSSRFRATALIRHAWLLSVTRVLLLPAPAKLSAVHRRNQCHNLYIFRWKSKGGDLSQSIHTTNNKHRTNSKNMYSFEMSRFVNTQSSWEIILNAPWDLLWVRFFSPHHW